MIEQGSEEWYAQRLGKLTASRMADVLATVKSGGAAASRTNYLAQLVCERLTGKVADAYESPDMRRGKELESFARAAYESKSIYFVVPAEFVTHPELIDLGASPDGLIDDDGLVEIKCLNAANHIEVLRSGVPSKYRAQIQTQLLVTGRKWCDFCAFHPDFPEIMQTAIYRVPADVEYQKVLLDEARKFLNEVDSAIASLMSMYKVAA